MNDAGAAMRYFQRIVADFSGLFTEDRQQQLFFRGDFALALRGDLTDQDVAFLDFRTDHDDAAAVEVAAGIFADVWNIAGNFFRSQLRFAAFNVVFLNMNRSVDIVADHPLGHDDRIFVVITVPGHERDRHVLA